MYAEELRPKDSLSTARVAHSLVWISPDCRGIVAVLVNLVGYLLLQHHEAKLEVPPLCKEVDRISTSLMPQVEQLVVTNTLNFLVLGVGTLVEGVLCRSPIPHGTGPSTFVSADGELRPRGREKE